MMYRVFLLLASLPFLHAAEHASSPDLTVDLGYGLYTGVYNASTSLNVWKGIRFAAPPLGKLRWQAPERPAVNRTPAVADKFGSACPQVLSNTPGANLVFMPGTEDCLFLNVYSPAANTSSRSLNNLLPVKVMIHGGGYGLGDGARDMSDFINGNGHGLVVVTIQYRVCTVPTVPLSFLFSEGEQLEDMCWR